MALSPTHTSPLLILTHEFHPRRGGIAVYVEETARAAAAAGHDVEVWAPRHAELTRATWPFKIREIPIRGSLDWICRARLSRMILRHSASFHDATVLLPEPGPILAFMYLRAMGWPACKQIIPILHGSEILRFHALPHRRYLFARLLRESSRIGVVSEFVRRLLRQKFPWADRKVVVVSGALRSSFKPVAKVHAPNSSSAGRVLTVARIHPRKGQWAMIEAWGQLPPELRQGWEYCLAGPVCRKRYLRRLQQRAVDNGVRLKLLGTPADEDLPELYASADIFAMTSQSSGVSVEGFGLAYLEAGAAGLPVLAWRSGGVPEAVRQDVSGWVLPAGRISALTTALEKLMREPEVRQRLGEGGRKRGSELSWAANIEKLLL